MGPLKRVLKIIPRGQFPDSRSGNRRYWLARPPEERIAALKELRESTYRHLTRRDLPGMVNVIRLFKPAI
jgi:hypothetical protein